MGDHRLISPSIHIKATWISGILETLLRPIRSVGDLGNPCSDLHSLCDSSLFLYPLFSPFNASPTSILRIPGIWGVVGSDAISNVVTGGSAICF